MQRTERVPVCEREAVWTDVTEIRRLNMIRPPLQSPLENIACCQVMRELAYFHKVRDMSLAHSLPFSTTIHLIFTQVTLYFFVE